MCPEEPRQPFSWFGCVACILGGLAILAALILGLLRFGGQRWL